MKLAVRVTVLTFALVACAQPAFAADDVVARREVAERIVALSTADAMTDSMIESVWPPVRDSIVAQNPGVSAELLGSMKTIMADTSRAMVLEMSGVVVSFYMEEFELGELMALEAFYVSPTGTKVLALTPKMMSQIMPTMLTQAQAMMPKLMEAIRKAAQERGLKLDI